VRIFTPGSELPFAGHPTIGTAFVLGAEGLLPAGVTQLALEEGIGPVPVRFEERSAAPTVIWMRHAAAAFEPELANRAAFAAALGLDESDLLDAPILVGTTGLPHLYVPLRDRAAVDRATLDVPALLRAFDHGKPPGVFVFAPNPEAGANRVYARMFAPLDGVPEGPATGSASGPLGAYLVRYGLVPPAPQVRIVSEQGTKMGRQSFIHIALCVTGGQVGAIEVGGSAVPVLSGTLRLP
jgi:trans-2,3-dihydro-3-hydroxyanthranilate isomerase